MTDMNAMMGKLAQHANHHAHHRFLDKMSHFKKFLDDFSKSHQGVVTTKVLKDLKDFAQRWVNIFAQGFFGCSSLGPLKILSEEIHQCESVSELREVVSKHIGAHDLNVGFLRRRESQCCWLLSSLLQFTWECIVRSHVAQVLSVLSECPLFPPRGQPTSGGWHAPDVAPLLLCLHHLPFQAARMVHVRTPDQCRLDCLQWCIGEALSPRCGAHQFDLSREHAPLL